jgi:hypothetical protein
MALSDYTQDAKALLHDYNGLFTPPAQLVRWINEARRQLAQKTGCVERLITGQSGFGASAQPGIAVPGGMQPGALPNATPSTGAAGGAFSNAFSNAFAIQSASGGVVGGAAVNDLQTIPGQERYPFQGFFNSYLQQQYAGCQAVIDVASLAVNWGGAVRPSLAWLPWEEFQAYCRAYATLVTSYPYYWTVFNPGEFGEIWMFPAPSTTGDIEVDAYCVPSDLNTNDDFDAIPPGYRNAIKFKAAELAFLASYRYQEAQMMGQMFDERIGVGGVARDRGKVPQFYGGSF